MEVVTNPNIHNDNIKIAYTIVKPNTILLCILYAWSDTLLNLIQYIAILTVINIYSNMNIAYNKALKDKNKETMSKISRIMIRKASFFIFFVFAYRFNSWTNVYEYVSFVFVSLICIYRSSYTVYVMLCIIIYIW